MNTTPSSGTTLIYLLHSGQMFGTERMALATLQALQPGCTGIVVAPPGPVHAAARHLGLESHVLAGRLALVTTLTRLLWQHRQAAILATGVGQSLVAALLQRALFSRGAHLHVVHGGTDERLSYGRKPLLRHLPVTFVAVSEFVRDRLIAHGVPAGRIEVVHNFLHGEPPARRGPFTTDGVRRVVMLSRLDRIKRVGLLFDALDKVPGLDRLQFDLYGSGELAGPLAERAKAHPNVTMHGFDPAAASALGQADLLLHTCPEEPFGLVMLEAFAAGVPVLVPNAGGAAVIVEDGVNGVHFTANNAVALGRQLLALADAPAGRLNALVAGGRRALDDRFEPHRQAAAYGRLAGATAT